MSSEKVIIWKVKKIGKLVEELISTGFNVTKAYQSANFSIGQSKTGNNYVLQMNHVELDDAGTYKCILTGSRESVTGIGTAQLVVLGASSWFHRARNSANILHVFIIFSKSSDTLITKQNYNRLP